MSPGDLSKALRLIDEAHAQDPNIVETKTSTTPTSTALPASSSPASGTMSIPYELHYARQMTSYLHLHVPTPSPKLQVAIRAQHFRRWEIPRSSYPEGKTGYLAWRTFLKKRQAEQVKEICLQAGFEEGEAEGVAGLIRKDGLMQKKKDGGDDNNFAEVQILEDVACLVFLKDQLEEFASQEKGHDEQKILRILRKTWAKMGSRGRELALKMEKEDGDGKVGELIRKALNG